jgi:hypothetical protein
MAFGRFCEDQMNILSSIMVEARIFKEFRLFLAHHLCGLRIVV